MSIKVKIEGFEEIIRKFEKAGQSIDKTIDDLSDAQAEIFKASFEASANKANVVKSLTPKMPHTVEKNGNVWRVRVGYAKNEFNGRNPENVHKLLFLNYGTPHRQEHGQIKKRGFVSKAKKNAKSKFNNGYKKALKKIVEDLK